MTNKPDGWIDFGGSVLSITRFDISDRIAKKKRLHLKLINDDDDDEKKEREKKYLYEIKNSTLCVHIKKLKKTIKIERKKSNKINDQ